MPAQSQPPPLPSQPARRKPSRRLLAMGSSVVFPGLGQYVHRRWLLGTLFLGLCLAGLWVALAPLVDWMLVYVHHMLEATEGDLSSGVPTVPWQPLLIGLLLVGVSYLGSVLDAARVPPDRTGSNADDVLAPTVPPRRDGP